MRLLIFLLTLVVLFVVEGSFNKPRHRTHEIINKGDPHVLVGWDEIGQFPPLSEISYEKNLYQMDEFGLRKESKNDNPTGHLIVGGCSFVFGIALDADETLTANLRMKYPALNVVNFGHGNGGIHTQLRAFDLLNMKTIAPENDGTYLYVFIPEHLARWEATPAFVNHSNPESVHYELENGVLTFTRLRESSQYKTFQDYKKWHLDYFYLRFSQMFHKSDTKKFVDGVEILKQKYLSHYPKGKFVFVFHPHPDHIKSEEIADIKHKLEAKKISYVDYSDDLRNIEYEDLLVENENHPNGAFNKFLAQHIDL